MRFGACRPHEQGRALRTKSVFFLVPGDLLDEGRVVAVGDVLLEPFVGLRQLLQVGGVGGNEMERAADSAARRR